MELQFDRTAVNYLAQALWQGQNQEQTQEVKLTDAMPDIGKVIGCWGQVILRGKEWRSNGIQTSGGVMAWVLYTPEGGGEPVAVETWLPFQMKWDFSQPQRDGSILIRPLLYGVDARSTSARKLMVRSHVGILAQALVPETAEVYTPGQVPEDVQLLKNTYPVTLMKEAGEKAFQIDDDLTLPAPCPRIDKLIRYTIQPELIDQKVMGDKVVFRGTAIVRLLYVGEDGRLKNWDFEVPFSQYGELERDYEEDACADVIPAVTALELELLESGDLHLKAGVVAQYMIRERQMLDIVTDGYSIGREATPQITELELPAILESRKETIHAERAIPTEGNQLIDIGFYPEQPRVSRNGEQMEVELPGSFQLLSYDSQGALYGNTARWETTFTLPVAQDVRMNAAVCLSGLPQASMGAGEVNARADSDVQLQSISTAGIPMVTGMQLGEEKTPRQDRPSLLLRRMGADGLWGVAKRCGSTVEEIRRVNHLTQDPEEDRMLLIPVP